MLRAGAHEIVFEVVDRTGSSAVSVALPAGVTGPSDGVIIAPAPAPSTSASCAGWHATYASGYFFGGPSASTECVSDPVSINWGPTSPVGVVGDNFTSELTRIVSLTPGFHTLDYDADDEFTLWVGADLVTSTEGGHSSINGRTQFFVPGNATLNLRVTVRSRDLGTDALIQFTIV